MVKQELKTYTTLNLHDYRALHVKCSEDKRKA